MSNGDPSSLYKVLVVGVGSIGERHVRCFLKTGRATVSICEVNSPLREEVAYRYKLANCFAELELALSTPHDAAVIAVPADLHTRISQQVVDAGLHVLIEKPLSVNMDGVNELIQAVSRTNRIAAVGYVYRAHPALAAMRDAIRSGSFGKPLELVAVAGQHFPTYRPSYRDTYYASRTRGGGAIQDAITHLVNAGEWLVGPIDRLVADASHRNLPGVDVEDVVHFLARHEDVIAVYSLNQFQAPNETAISVVCERGTARFEAHNNRWRWMAGPEEPWHDELAIGVERDTVFIRQANAFLDAIEHRTSAICTLEEGAQTLRVNLALIESVQCERWQSIPTSKMCPK